MVNRRAVEPRFPLKREGGEVLARAFAEGLPGLWRVDPEEADSVLLLVAVKQRERVAILDRDDTPGECVGGTGRGKRGG